MKTGRDGAHEQQVRNPMRKQGTTTDIQSSVAPTMGPAQPVPAAFTAEAILLETTQESIPTIPRKSGKKALARDYSCNINVLHVYAHV